MTKLSFIVPVYNVEKYLHKCVDSLLAQDYSNYEIIFVDDGSTDNSGVICDEYELKSQESRAKRQEYPLIHVIHQENAGLSAARNAGLKMAKGEYVCFVDSDDYWEKNVLGGLMEQVERDNLDVLRFDYQNVNNQYEVYNPNKAPRYIDKCTGVVDGETYLNTRMGYACYAVMYIMRREIVPLFTDGIHFEDVEWLPRMMLRAKKVNSTTKVVYDYLIRQGSITKPQGDKVRIQKNLEDQMFVIQKLTDLLACQQNCQWLRQMRDNMSCGVLTTVAMEFYAKRKDFIKRLTNMNVFPISIVNQSRVYIRRARIINIFGPQVYCAIMHLR